MTIGVYRLYVSHAWASEPALADVIAALDAYPAFLYRIDRLSDEELATPTEGGVQSAVRVAMTQTHVMLAPFRPSAGPQPAVAGDALPDIEMALARTGFRRRIPVLGVADCDADPAEARRAGFDRIVRPDPATLMCSIQELAEEAAAERRAANALALQMPLTDQAEARAKSAFSGPAFSGPAFSGPVPVMRAQPVVAETGPRALPVNEIIEAFRTLVSARQSIKPAT